MTTRAPRGPRGCRRAWRGVGCVAAGLVLAGTLAACGTGSSGTGSSGTGAGVPGTGAGVPGTGAGVPGTGAGVSGGATVQVSQDDLDGLQAATSDAERTAAQAEQDLASDD